MRATDMLADPLVELTARLLTGPVQELYAVAWRVGLLEVEHAAPRLPSAAVRTLPLTG